MTARLRQQAPLQLAVSVITEWKSNAGWPIGAYDVLLAACALRRGLKIVTHNVREFARMGGLGLEDGRER